MRTVILPFCALNCDGVVLSDLALKNRSVGGTGGQKCSHETPEHADTKAKGEHTAAQDSTVSRVELYSYEVRKLEVAQPIH